VVRAWPRTSAALIERPEARVVGTKTLQSLLDEIRRALEMERTKPEAAVLSLRGVLSEALRQGVESAYLRYVLAQALELNGELEMAFDEIKKAMKLDPLALPIRHAFQELAGRIRASLTDPARAVDDPEVPRLYTVLLEAGEADLAAHLAMVRFELATAQLVKARERVEAVTRLFPAHREAWVLLAQVARAQGEAEVALRAETEAATAVARDPLFGVVGQAKA
jgi:tetratricopeptide (TPR) repeat protein